MPVSTSPVPPRAIPGLPVGFRKTVPSGAAITLAAPLRTRYTRWAVAKSRATSMRSRLHVRDARRRAARAISPGCGVRQRGAGALCSTIQVARERGERVGVDDHRAARLEHRGARRAPASLAVEPEARAQRDRVAPAHEIAAAPVHAPWPTTPARPSGSGAVIASSDEPGDDRLLAGGRRDGDESGAASHRAVRRERRGARLAAASRHDQQMAVRALVGRARRAAGSARATSPASSTNVVMPRATSAAGTPMSTTLTRPASRAPAPATSAALETGERHRRDGAHDGAARRAAIGGQARRNVERDHRTPAALIASIAPATRPSGAPRAPVPSSASTTRSARAARAASARASVDDVGRRPRLSQLAQLAGGVAADVRRRAASKTSQRTPAPREPARDHESVAAVAAFAAHDRDATAARGGSSPRRATRAPRRRRRAPRAPSGWRRGCPARDGALVEPAHLLAGEDGPHGSASGRQRGGLGEEVREDGHVRLARLGARDARQLEVERAGRAQAGRRARHARRAKPPSAATRTRSAASPGCARRCASRISS